MKYPSYSKRIASLRANSGETQQELADALGVKRETVKFWESGERQIKVGDICRLALHFGVSTDYVIGLSDVASTNEDLQMVHRITGLNEAALNTLAKIKAIPEQMEVLNLLLSTFSDDASSREVVLFAASACYFAHELEKQLTLLEANNEDVDWAAMQKLFFNARWYRFDVIDSFTNVIDEISHFQEAKRLFESAKEKASQSKKAEKQGKKEAVSGVDNTGDGGID